MDDRIPFRSNFLWKFWKFQWFFPGGGPTGQRPTARLQAAGVGTQNCQEDHIPSRELAYIYISTSTPGEIENCLQKCLGGGYVDFAG